MKKRYHFLIVGIVLIIGIILGSFLDKNLSEAIFDRYNGLSLTISAFGKIPGLAFLAFGSGVLLETGIKKKGWNVWFKILLFAYAFILFGLCVYMLGDDLFSVNGFNKEKVYYLGFPIMAVIMSPFIFLGFLFSKKTKNPKVWLIVLIFTAAAICAFGGIYLMKIIFHRPRYRIVVHDGLISFHYWWEPCFNYKDFLKAHTELSDSEFKSLPSGHSGETMIAAMFMIFLGTCDKRLQKLHPLPFYIGVTWCAIVMFSRIVVGAHYLSDVCFGALIALICLYIGNEFVLRYCPAKEEKPIEEEKVE